MQSTTALSERAEVRALMPPPTRDASPKRAFDAAAALGRPRGGLLGAAQRAVSLESSSAFDSAVRALHERSARVGAWPHARAPGARPGPAERAPAQKSVRDLLAATRERASPLEHYAPAVRNTMAVRRDGLMRGAIEEEGRPWQPVQLAMNEGLTPSAELLERRRPGGRAAASAEDRAAVDALERTGFTRSSLRHRALPPQDLRALAATERLRGSDGRAPDARSSDWLNGKPSAHAFRDEPARSGRTLEGGKADMDLVSRPAPSGQFVPATLRGGPLPMRLQMTENAHPASRAGAEAARGAAAAAAEGAGSGRADGAGGAIAGGRSTRSTSLPDAAAASGRLPGYHQ